MEVWVNGTDLGQQFSSFQYGSTVSIDLSYALDGTLAGSVMGDGNTFSFNDGIVAPQSGSNFMASINFIGGGQEAYDNIRLDPISSSSGTGTDVPEPATLPVRLFGF